MEVMISVGDTEVITAGAPFNVRVCAVPQFRFVPVMVTSVPTGPVSGSTAVMGRRLTFHHGHGDGVLIRQMPVTDLEGEGQRPHLVRAWCEGEAARGSIQAGIGPEPVDPGSERIPG